MSAIRSPGALRTGQVAQQASVNPQTLRYYQRRGLVPNPPAAPAATAPTRRRPSPSSG